MSGKTFNDAFRRALRPESAAEEEPPAPDENPKPPPNIDAGAGSRPGPRIKPHSMNDLIRRAAQDRE
jgi:hypothetical protein